MTAPRSTSPASTSTPTSAPTSTRPPISSSAFPPDTFVGPAFVLDIARLPKDRIETSDLGDLTRIPRRSRLLLRTRSSACWHGPSPAADLAFLDPQAIDALLARRPVLVGLDAYSLDPVDSTTFPAHTLVCPPLPVALEASPVRALLFSL